MRRKSYLWDTNALSDVVKGLAETRDHHKSVAPDQIATSVITEAEVRFRLAKKPEATRYAATVNELLRTIPVLSWTPALTLFYATLRMKVAKEGIVIGGNDLLIATRAYHGTLVTSDQGLICLNRGLPSKTGARWQEQLNRWNW